MYERLGAHVLPSTFNKMAWKLLVIRGLKIGTVILLLVTVYHLLTGNTRQSLQRIFVTVEMDDVVEDVLLDDVDYDVKKHKVEPGYVVPNIMHYTWYDTRPERLRFRFHHLISMLSAYKYNKPQAIYLWYEIMPRGPIWREALERIPVLHPIYRKGPAEIFGNQIRTPEHQSDLVRLETVLRYGGIYTDLDIIVLKSMAPLRKFNTTLGKEEDDKLCNGVIIGTRQAKFLKIWYKHYQTFDDKVWGYHSVQLPAILAEKYPALVHVEETSLHRPNWRPENRRYLYEQGLFFNYSQNYAVHLYYRWYNYDHNAEDIKTLDSTLGRIFRQVYYGSPDLMGIPKNVSIPTRVDALLPG
ncbi:uncharacterized protein LOC141911026 [Tubulanus polymorphus]|uniref:uncharacterized protein LOC141911026 n=1 Tax=Tubulanus polymorphus TaxID=672921 RepID=UPI003DA56F5B